MAGHTPGPWRVIFSEDNGAAMRIEANDGDVPGGVGSVVRQNGIGMPGCDVGKANARLISAAPDLLMACKAVAEQIDKGPPVHPLSKVVDYLQAAIVKATGQPATGRGQPR